MVHDRIRSLLEDAYASSLLTHTAGVLGHAVGQPMRVINTDLPISDVKKIFYFRQSLLGDQQEWVRPFSSHSDVRDAFDKHGLQDYWRASSLELAADLYAWVRAGKRVWFVEDDNYNVHQHGDHTPNPNELSHVLPSTSTMVWLEKPVTHEYNGKTVTCNLVLFTRVADDWFLRLFCNPIEERNQPLISLQQQERLAQLSTAKPSSKKKPMHMEGQNVYLPDNQAQALLLVQKFSKRLVANYEPNGMAGSLLCVFRPGESELLISSHMSDLCLEVLHRVTVWAKSPDGHQKTPMEMGRVTSTRKKNKAIPRKVTLFSPEEVFLIRHTRVVSGESSGSRGEQGTGRMVTVEHTRRGHWRTLNRDTNHERQVWVNQAHVVPKEAPTEIPKGVLIKPRK